MNDNTIIQLLKSYLKTNLGSPASHLLSQSFKISTNLVSRLNPSIDLLEYDRLDRRNVQDPFTVKTYKVMSPYRRVISDDVRRVASTEHSICQFILVLMWITVYKVG